jgi:hypothetical protein
MVYIGSIDSRVDFAWLDALAANDVTIGIFGSIHGTAPPETHSTLKSLLKRRKNVTFHGPYDNDDLEGLLSQFRVGLLPYQVDHPMTEHVNPDKLYHYLNAGLMVLASPIPAARRLQRYLHLITSDGNWVIALQRLATAVEKDWPRELYSWDGRWSELISVASSQSKGQG